VDQVGYKIGEVAKMLEMSSEGIRFFERKGLVTGSRSANHYRVYERKDLFTLFQCLRYSQMGFTLEQSKDLFFAKNISNAIDMFDRQIREKEKAIQRETELLSNIKDFKEQLEHVFLNEGRIVIEKMPGIYVYSLKAAEDSPASNESSFFHSSGKLFPAGISGRHFRRLPDDSYESSGEVCVYIEEDKTNQLGIALPEETFYCPSCICATQVINIGTENAAEYDYAKHMLEALETDGITPAGDIQVWYIFFSFKDGAEQRYCKIIVPIDPKK